MKLQAFTILGLLSIKALALPSGAPNCDLTGPSPRSTHNRAGATIGTIEDGGITVTIDGCEVEVGEPFEVEVFEPVTVTISRDTPFRGVLARFNIDQAIGLLEGETDLQVSDPCDLAGVS